MELDISIDGKKIATLTVDRAALARVLATASDADDTFSTPMTPRNAKDLLSRIDPKSVELLTAIANSDNGRIMWGDVKEILDIEEWKDFSRRYGKGITRAFRHILDDGDARLIHWDDDDWEGDEDEWDDCEMWVDGQALESLRIAVA